VFIVRTAPLKLGGSAMLHAMEEML